MPRFRQLGGMIQSLHLTLATHELRVTAGRPTLQASAQRPQPGHFVDIDWFTHPLNFGRTQRLEQEVAFAQTPDLFCGRDRSDGGKTSIRAARLIECPTGTYSV